MTGILPAAGEEDALGRTVRSLGLAALPPRLATLAAYLELLAKWGGVYNLTAIREPRQAVLRHLVDCLLCIEPLRRQAPHARTLLDVGSGGGLPGLVIATMLPAVEVTCIDAVAKKAAFIQQAVIELGLTNACSLHGRVETLASRRPAVDFDVIAARAFGSLDDLVGRTHKILAPGGIWMAMKAEIEPVERVPMEARDDLAFHVEPLPAPAELGTRNLVWISKLG